MTGRLTLLEAWVGEYDRRATEAAADRVAPYADRRAHVAGLEAARDRLLGLALDALDVEPAAVR